MITKLFLMSALVAGGVSVANAQDAAPAAPAPSVPMCSKTVTDKCMTATHKVVVHKHKKAVKKTSTTTTKTM